MSRPRTVSAPRGRAPGCTAPQRALVVRAQHLAQMEKHARQAYPAECCGILLGSRGAHTRVSSVHPTPNGSARIARDRYHIDPREMLRLQRAGADSGEEVVGFYHSHPDHPAIPSAADAAQAWAEYSYVIVAVAGGKRTHARAWVFDEECRAFSSQPIIQSAQRAAPKRRGPHTRFDG